MSKQVKAREKLERLSDDLQYIQKQAEPGGISPVIGYGRSVGWGGRRMHVVASAVAPKGVIVEFIHDRHLLGRTSYGVDNRTWGQSEVFQSSPYTVPALAKLVTGKEIEADPRADEPNRIHAKEIDFVVGFFRDPQNDLLLARLRPQSVGDPLYGLHAVPLGDVSFSRLDASRP